MSLLAGGVNYNFRTPGHEPAIVVRDGRGPWIETTDGRRLFDLFAAFGAQAFPHGCADYARVIAESVQVYSGSLPSVWIEEACAALLDLFPHHTSVRFCVSGTEATQLAVRLARAATGRNRVLRFESHYHGHLDALLGGSYSPATFPEPFIDYDDPRATDGGIPQAVQALNFVARWNNVEDLRTVFDRYGDEIAAVLLEPVAINAGGAAPAARFLDAVRLLCDQHGAVLVFDEIITGFRAGLGGWQARSDVRPDITLLGKMLGGGAVPVSAVLSSKDLLGFCANHRVVHGGTFNGSPLAARVVSGTVALLRAPGTLSMESLQRAGSEIFSTVRELVGRERLPISVSGLPAAFWIRPITADDEHRNVTVAALRKHLLDAGVLPAMPTRCYVTAGLTPEDIAEGTRRIMLGIRSFSLDRSDR